MPKTEKLEFEGGDWWEIRAFLTVSQEREYTSVGLQAYAADGDLAKLTALGEVADRLTVAVTTAWSYGPLTLDTLLNVVPGAHYRQAQERMADLYRPLVAANVLKLQESFSLLSGGTTSPANGGSAT